MDKKIIDRYIAENRKKLFPNKKISESDLYDALSDAPDEFEELLWKIPLRKPIVAFLLSPSPSDRLYLRDFKKAALKTFTLNGLLLWGFIDIFTATKRCRKHNCENIINSINDPSVAQKLLKMDLEFGKVKDTAKKYAPVAKALYTGAKEIQNGMYVGGTAPQENSNLTVKKANENKKEFKEFNFYDAKGNYCRSDGLFYDWKGNLCKIGGLFYDSKGYLCDSNSCFYDGKGYYCEPGAPFYDAKGYYITPRG